jgi:hypothetical protein
MGNLKDLCAQTIVYPSPDQMLLRGSKLWVIDQLREIARTVTRTDYPEVVLINNPQDPTWAHQPGLFIKRSFSDSAAHVLRASDKNASVLMSAMVTDTKEFYDHDSVRKYNIVPEWLGMAFIPEMSQKGEIKAFFIGGQLTHTICTAPLDRKLKIDQVFEVTPLSHLSYVFFFSFFFLHSILFIYSSPFPQENRRTEPQNGKAFDGKATRF